MEPSAPPASSKAALRFYEATLHGAWLIEPRPIHDHRGFFARTFCAQAYAEHGLMTEFVQHSRSYSAAKGTLRGMHFQRDPHEEVKVVTCLKGEICDVIIDLRRDSPTFMRWEGFRLSAENRRQLYVPAGFAHGFQCLSPQSEVAYLISTFYVPEAADGVRYDDPAFAISWPLPPVEVSARDREWPDFPASERWRS
jgi:dTDP-4-dehydrorhamnose 3,5-epimerase